MQRILLAAWRPIGRPVALALLAGAIVLGQLSIAAAVQAQGGDRAWTEPLNLSRSGGATNPIILADSGGGLHVVWQDVYADLVYVHNTGGGWEAPVALDLPFAGLAPELVADGNGWVHALWVDEELNLLHQRAQFGSMGDAANWSAAATVATDVVAFAATLDTSDRLWVGYARGRETSEAPAGIYVVPSQASAAGWNSPDAVYLSPYFRTLLAPEDRAAPEAAQAALGHVDIAAAALDGTTQVYVTWDQPGLNQVRLARSADGGATWGEPVVVDGPDASSPYRVPQHLRVSAAGSQVLLLWDAGLAGGVCTAAYRFSEDAGASWLSSGDVMPGTSACPDAMQLLPQPDGTLILLATLQNQAYLLAWNGEQWSLPQGQGQLDSFLNPTSFSFVDLDCLQAASFASQLYAVGCEASANGDIWFASRALDAVSDWFAPPSGWGPPLVLPVGEEAISGLAISAEVTGRVHAVWTQPNEQAGSAATARLTHAAWDNGELIGPFDIFGNLAGPTGRVETAFEPGGRLLTVWAGGASQALYFSLVGAAQANSSESWGDAAPLPTGPLPGASPQAAIGEGGQAWIAYAVPLNEGRGVYVTGSTDRGATWSAPILVFDGAGGGCPMVTAPSLAVTFGNHLHALWTCSALPGGGGMLALYRARSLDGGQTWLPAERVVDHPVAWSQVVSTGANQLHQVWREAEGQVASLWHASSSDDGATFSPPASLGLVEGWAGPASLAVDAAGGLHLLQAEETSQDGAQIRYWAWEGGGWSSGETMHPATAGAGEVTALDAVAEARGQLVVVFARPGTPDLEGAAQTEVVFAARPISTSGGEPAATPAATSQAPAATPTDEAQATPAAETSTATPAASLTLESPGGTAAMEPTLGLMLGVVSAAVVVLGVAVFGVLRARNR